VPADQYILRFDDICPTMNWAVWERIEDGLRQYNVRPILAVVPDNHDPKLMVDSPRPDFWERVRQWQADGYTIALHGYQHLYVNRNWGLMKLTPQSEFAGVSREEQEAKLRAALAIFSREGVRAECWVAPAHSFDRTTVAVLAELGVRVISDGLEPLPYRDSRGVIWVPQQLWNFRRKPAGVWTVCQHHNGWSEEDCDRFLRNLATFAPQMSDLSAIAASYGTRKRTLSDRAIAVADLLWNHRLRPPLAKLARRVIFGGEPR